MKGSENMNHFCLSPGSDYFYLFAEDALNSLQPEASGPSLC